MIPRLSVESESLRIRHVTPLKVPMSADRKEVIRAAIAAELRLPLEILTDDATVGSVGLDSLGLAQAVVAVEEAVAGEVDTARLSELLTPEMTLGQLMAAIDTSLVDAPAAAGAA